MKPFMDDQFLLTTPAAQALYHQYVENLPIVDYHCHVSPREIYEDRHFENISQVWLSGDHYKWRLMRSNGVEERYITGDATDREKFQKFAEALPRAIGNPLYHWCHLELKTYFGYEGVLNGETAQQVWDLCAAQLAKPDMGVRGIIEKSNVAFIGTTDDPVDSLEWHGKLAQDPGFHTIVGPSFRPDQALNMEKPAWRAYIARLGEAAGMEIADLDSLEQALALRMDHFTAHGCRASDHGLDYMVFRPMERADVDAIFRRAIGGEAVTMEEIEAFKTELLLFCGRRYAKMGWVMQIHYNCLRNPNSAMLAALGPDTGFDCIGPHNGGRALAGFLDALNRDSRLPRTILYSLDPTDNAFLDTLIGSFQGSDIPGKVQHGAAWWFNDTMHGMRDQMTSLASLSVLGNFVGMLTDSRSFLSYTRHAYFRRILCDLLGGWMERGEYPDDLEQVGALAQDIACRNALRYFNLTEVTL